jgi:hypothetical protein
MDASIIGSKLFDLLKAHPWQMAMVAAALALFLYLVSAGTVPDPGDGWKALIWLVMLIAAGLALAPVGSTAQAAINRTAVKWRRRREAREAEQEFRNSIQHLTDKERQILGYLRKKNQRMFEADADGGFASTLLARGIVRMQAGPGGQVIYADRVPIIVPDHVWRVMQELPDEFPYRPEYNSGPGKRVEAHPWRIPWMAR